jgi:hypothetical protein
MIVLLMILLAVSTLGLGIAIGRDYTKWECGKMLVWLEQGGYLHRPDEDTDDEEDFK